MTEPRSRIAWLASVAVIAEMEARGLERLKVEVNPDPREKVYDSLVYSDVLDAGTALVDVSYKAERKLRDLVKDHIHDIYPNVSRTLQQELRDYLIHLVWERAAEQWPCPEARRRKFETGAFRGRWTGPTALAAGAHMRERAFPALWAGRQVPPFRWDQSAS